jgi:ABC-2 type transport system permease protein
MERKKKAISFVTIFRREVARFFRIWTQTLLPSVVTTALHFAIFGSFIGSQVRNIHGTPYIQFIVPGLIMMAVINNAFANVVGSFFGAKFSKSIEEVLVSPTPSWIIIAGYAAGGVLRSLISGALALVVALFFTRLAVTRIVLVAVFMLLSAVFFSLGGLLNALFARKFDDTAIIPTFVLTPLIYLGGVFYSISALPPFWQSVSKLNPILYLINGFRHGFLGFSDVPLGVSIAVLLAGIAVLLLANLYFFKKGYGLKV